LDKVHEDRIQPAPESRYNHEGTPITEQSSSKDAFGRLYISYIGYLRNDFSPVPHFGDGFKLKAIATSTIRGSVVRQTGRQVLLLWLIENSLQAATDALLPDKHQKRCTTTTYKATWFIIKVRQARHFWYMSVGVLDSLTI